MTIDKNALESALMQPGEAYIVRGEFKTAESIVDIRFKRWKVLDEAARAYLAILNAVDSGEAALVPTNSSPDMMLSGLKAFVADVQERLGKHKKNDEKLDHDELLQLQGFRMGAVTHNTWEIRAAWYAMLRAAGRHPLLGGE